MSSLANCDNHATTALMSESDDDDENQYDSSYNRQNESMMHKVKDVMSKLLHPSFLFSADNDTDRPKRKRSTSVEEDNDEKQSHTTTTTTSNGDKTTSKSQNRRAAITADEPQITDDEDNNSRDVPSTEQDSTDVEQQRKRRRTANYQHILSTKTTDSHHEDERTSSPSTLTDSVRSFSNRRIDHTSNAAPVIFPTTTEQTYNERINRLTPSKQRFHILPTYRGSPSTYDPSKSPLFSANNRRTTETTTNLRSHEFSADHLLASGLVNRPQSSTTNRQPSPATLTNPVTNNRLLSNERQLLGVNYASINSRRLPYIERLRRRTLQDCIRLNRTLDSEPLSVSILEEHKTTTTNPPTPQKTKAPEKDCGIQCDILITEPSRKVQRTFPPEDIRKEALSVPTTEKIQSSSQTDSPLQTNSSITIEKVQPPVPIIDITKSKVLGNITPFSWPKFARGQATFAEKHPEKCRDDALVPTKSVFSFVSTQLNVNNTPVVPHQTSTTTGTSLKTPTFYLSSSRPIESIWKCPVCTKEHPAQTASCSLCRGINPNYIKLGAVGSPATTEKEAASSTNLTSVTPKEPSISTPVTTSNNLTIPTTTKESVLSVPPVVTTSATSSSFPPFSFGTTSATSLATTATTKENPITTTATITTATPILSFGTATASVTSPITTKENPVPISIPQPVFGVTPTVSFTTSKENTITTSTTSSFSTAVTKENPVTTSAPFSFGTFPTSAATTTVPPLPTTTTSESAVTTTASWSFGVTTLDKTSAVSTSSPFQIGTTFPTFTSSTSTNVTTAASASAVPAIVTTTSSMPTLIQVPTLPLFGQFGSTSAAITTPSVSLAVSSGSSNTSASVTFPLSSSISSSTTTSVPSFFNTTPSTTSTTALAPASSTTSSFSTQSSFTFTPTTTASTAPPFGTGSLTFAPAATTTTTATPPFTFGGSSSIRPFAPTPISSTNPNSTASFPTTTPFGATASFGTNSTSITDKVTPTGPSFSFGQSTQPPAFGFSPAPTTTTNPLQSSTAPLVSTGGFTFGTTSSTIPTTTAGGFSFTPSSSATAMPVFGAGPTPLSAAASLNPFGFGGTSAASAGTPPFPSFGVTPTASSTASTFPAFGVAPTASIATAPSYPSFGITPTTSTTVSSFSSFGATPLGSTATSSFSSFGAIPTAQDTSMSTTDTPNPFSITDAGSSSIGQRVIRRPKRHLKP